ncbi:uncharacterized protein LOC62_08G009839 [Vanrija pseudolonga]|uniref:Agd3 CBM87 domain-containing protein n=1 Tax=Vanrija pseudolonga TaxID=143232 RepID=A0AAF0YG93_9TREE|nr:hypothetical protein LOC62_08G009839 [Vanrija pseudolonga]
MSSSTSASASDSASSSASDSASVSASVTAWIQLRFDQKILILARDAGGILAGANGLQVYGIPYEQLLVPQEGAVLPVLNNTPTHGRYSGIIIMDALAYSYQVSFNIRMVRINEHPGPSFGVSLAGGGCCNAGVTQPVSLIDTSNYSSANVKVGATVSSQGLYH